MSFTTHEKIANPIATTTVSSSSDRPFHYMPQLDALRAFAVGLVILEHWLPRNFLLESINPGYIGVVFFFVLSGFLITNILLNTRLKTNYTLRERGRSLYKFIMRRSLRIFPIYYLTIFVCYILGLANIREKFIWYATYLSNYYVFNTQSWGGPLTHLWTLAVEEQFYFFWPLLILFIPQRWLLQFICAFILIGPMSRVLISLSYETHLVDNLFTLIITPSCFDAFGMGALLAYFKQENIKKQFANKVLSILLALIAGVFLVTALVTEMQDLSNLIKGSIIAAFSFWIIHRASIGFQHPILKAILENNSMIYIGKISYGIYLFHTFIPYLFSLLVIYSRNIDVRNPITGNFLFTEIENPIIRFLTFLSLLVLLAALSWHVIEKPINNLKNRFSYAKHNHIGHTD